MFKHNERPLLAVAWEAPTPALTIPFAIRRRLRKHPPQVMRNCLRHPRTHLAGAVLLLSLTSVALAASSDWPQFRGPHRDGASAETRLLQELPPGGPPLVWKATGLGVGYSTVSVVGKRLYTIGENTEFSSVVALNTADGKKVWSAKLGKPGAPGQPAFEGPRATPTVEGDLLAAVSQWGELACYEIGRA